MMAVPGPISGCSDIRLDTICSVVSSLRSVVAEFYGPQCSQTLLTSQTGKAVVTSDGFTILESLQPEHPVAQLVFKAIRRCHNHTLDGCKVFLLYLESILKGVNSAISQGKFCHGGVNLAQNPESLERQGRVCARLYIRNLIEHSLQNSYQAILSHSFKTCNQISSSCSLKDLLTSVCKTTLMTHYSPKVCQLFASNLVSAFKDIDKDHNKFVQTLNTFVDKFYSLIIKIPNRPYSQCTSLEPLLINCKFSVKCEDFGSRPIKAVLLRCSIDHVINGDESKEVFCVQREGQITNFLLHRRKVVQAFASSCSKLGVNLLLCTESVPGFGLEIFQRHGISVIAYILPEDLEILETISVKVSVTSISDEIVDNNLILLDAVKELVIGGHRYLQLQAALLPWKHLILCAPTVGLCDQVAMMCHKALNSIRMCFVSYKESTSEELHDEDGSDKVSVADNLVICDYWITKLKDLKLNESPKAVDKEDKKLAIIAGGGAFELVLASKVSECSKHSTDANVKVLCNTLENSLLNVLSVLFKNTNVTNENKRCFLETLTGLREKVSVDGVGGWGIDRRGNPRNMFDHRVLEPVVSKIHVLECVLNLVDQLLGVDKVVSIRKMNDDARINDDDSDDS